MMYKIKGDVYIAM